MEDERKMKGETWEKDRSEMKGDKKGNKRKNGMRVRGEPEAMIDREWREEDLRERWKEGGR